MGTAAGLSVHPGRGLAMSNLQWFALWMVPSLLLAYLLVWSARTKR